MTYAVRIFVCVCLTLMAAKDSMEFVLSMEKKYLNPEAYGEDDISKHTTDWEQETIASPPSSETFVPVEDPEIPISSSKRITNKKPYKHHSKHARPSSIDSDTTDVPAFIPTTTESSPVIVELKTNNQEVPSTRTKQVLKDQVNTDNQPKNEPITKEAATIHALPLRTTSSDDKTESRHSTPITEQSINLNTEIIAEELMVRQLPKHKPATSVEVISPKSTTLPDGTGVGQTEKPINISDIIAEAETLMKQLINLTSEATETTTILNIRGIDQELLVRQLPPGSSTKNADEVEKSPPLIDDVSQTENPISASRIVAIADKLVMQLINRTSETETTTHFNIGYNDQDLSIRHLAKQSAPKSSKSTILPLKTTDETEKSSSTDRIVVDYTENPIVMSDVIGIADKLMKQLINGTSELTETTTQFSRESGVQDLLVRQLPMHSPSIAITSKALESIINSSPAPEGEKPPSIFTEIDESTISQTDYPINMSGYVAIADSLMNQLINRSSDITKTTPFSDTRNNDQELLVRKLPMHSPSIIINSKELASIISSSPAPEGEKPPSINTEIVDSTISQTEYPINMSGYVAIADSLMKQLVNRSSDITATTPFSDTGNSDQEVLVRQLPKHSSPKLIDLTPLEPITTLPSQKLSEAEKSSTIDGTENPVTMSDIVAIADKLMKQLINHTSETTKTTLLGTGSNDEELLVRQLPMHSSSPTITSNIPELKNNSSPEPEENGKDENNSTATTTDTELRFFSTDEVLVRQLPKQNTPRSKGRKISDKGVQETTTEPSLITETAIPEIYFPIVKSIPLSMHLSRTTSVPQSSDLGIFDLTSGRKEIPLTTHLPLTPSTLPAYLLKSRQLTTFATLPSTSNVLKDTIQQNNFASIEQNLHAPESNLPVTATTAEQYTTMQQLANNTDLGTNGTFLKTMAKVIKHFMDSVQYTTYPLSLDNNTIAVDGSIPMLSQNETNTTVPISVVDNPKLRGINSPHALSLVGSKTTTLTYPIAEDTPQANKLIDKETKGETTTSLGQLLGKALVNQDKISSKPLTQSATAAIPKTLQFLDRFGSAKLNTNPGSETTLLTTASGQVKYNFTNFFSEIVTHVPASDISTINTESLTEINPSTQMSPESSDVQLRNIPERSLSSTTDADMFTDMTTSVECTDESTEGTGSFSTTSASNGNQSSLLQNDALFGRNLQTDNDDDNDNSDNLIIKFKSGVELSADDLGKLRQIFQLGKVLTSDENDKLADILQVGKDMTQEHRDKLVQLFEAGKNITEEEWKDLTDMYQETKQSFINETRSAIANFTEEGKEILNQTVTKVTNVVKEGEKTVNETITKIANQTKVAVSGAIKDGKEVLNKTVNKVNTAIEEGNQKANETITKIANQTKAAVSGGIKEGKQVFNKTVNKVNTAIEEEKQKANETITKIANQTKAAVSGGIKEGKQVVNKTVNKVNTAIEEGNQKANETFTKVANQTKAVVASAAEEGKAIANQTSEMGKQAVNQTKAVVASAVEEGKAIANQTSEMGKQAVNQTKAVVASAVEEGKAIANQASEMGQQAVNQTKGQVIKVIQVGKEIANKTVGKINTFLQGFNKTNPNNTQQTVKPIKWGIAKQQMKNETKAKAAAVVQAGKNTVNETRAKIANILQSIKNTNQKPAPAKQAPFKISLPSFLRSKNAEASNAIDTKETSDKEEPAEEMKISRWLSDDDDSTTTESPDWFAKLMTDIKEFFSYLWNKLVSLLPGNWKQKAY